MDSSDQIMQMADEETVRRALLWTKLEWVLKSSTSHIRGYRNRLCYGEGSVTPIEWFIIRDGMTGSLNFGQDFLAALEKFNELEKAALYEKG